MDFSSVDPIARAILYEGYRLYPYRLSSLKNSRPCAFGSLVPRAYSLANGEGEPWSMQTECLVRGSGQTVLHGRVRFLQYGPENRDVLEREVILPPCSLCDLAERSARIGFAFADGQLSSIDGYVELAVVLAGDSIIKVSLRVENASAVEHADDPLVAADTMHSTHSVLGVENGLFLSMIDPPADVRELADACRNRGAWPVLVGDRQKQNMILAAPIILYDFPQIAPESPGNLFDGTEIDEILSLRILTLTDSEKQAMKSDERSRALLERTEKLANDQLLALHGEMREIHNLERRIQAGDRVRLRPSTSARQDIFDLALAGTLATVASIEENFEGMVFYTVTLDEDPGRDLGLEGKPGHRFFFRREELEFLTGGV